MRQHTRLLPQEADWGPLLFGLSGPSCSVAPSGANRLPTCSRREAVPWESRSAASATSSCASAPPSWPASAARLLLSALATGRSVPARDSVSSQQPDWLRPWRSAPTAISENSRQPAWLMSNREASAQEACHSCRPSLTAAAPPLFARHARGAGQPPAGSAAPAPGEVQDRQ